MIRPHPIVPVLVLGTTFAGTEARGLSQGINVLENAPVATAQQAPGETAQYLVAYRAHMASTWNIRYAVTSSLRMMDRAVQNSDSDAARYYKVLTTELWQKVRAEDERFYRDWESSSGAGHAGAATS